MVHGAKWWAARQGGQHRLVLAGVIATAVGTCSAVGWFVVAGWGGSAAAAQMQSLGRGRRLQPQLSVGEARVGLDARLERLNGRQARADAPGSAAAKSAAGPRVAMREPSPPPRVPPTPPLDLLEEAASRAMEGQP